MPAPSRQIYGTTIHWHTTIPNLRMLYGASYVLQGMPGGDLHRWFLNGTYDRQMCDAVEPTGSTAGQGIFLANNRYLVPSAQRGEVLEYSYDPVTDSFHKAPTAFASVPDGFPIFVCLAPKDNSVLVSRFSDHVVSAFLHNGQLIRTLRTTDCSPQQLAVDGDFIWTTCLQNDTLARTGADEDQTFDVLGAVPRRPTGIAVGRKRVATDMRCSNFLL